MRGGYVPPFVCLRHLPVALPGPGTHHFADIPVGVVLEQQSGDLTPFD